LRQIPSLDSILAVALGVLSLTVIVSWVRAPLDIVVLLQAGALVVLLVALIAYRRRTRLESELRVAREAGLTRILQGLSRSTSSDAIVETIVTDLLRTARADHAVVIGRRSAGDRVEATLVSATRDVEPTTIQLPRDALDFDNAAPGAITTHLNRRVRSTFGLVNTTAAPLVVNEELVGALVLSRRAARWTAGDRRLLGWAAREVSAALQRAYAFEAAESQAKLDPLTGLPNRRFLEELVSASGRGRRAGDRTGALMIDIDHFKVLNDTYGHRVGDNVLRAVAEQIAVAVRASDTPVRYGGEEFAVLLRQANLEQAQEVAERIRRSIATMDATELGAGRSVTVSIGVAVSGGGQVDVPGLLELADQALYRAKRQGRNMVAVA
jgi:diguanylate cyclase (GGDEF)-like protein